MQAQARSHRRWRRFRHRYGVAVFLAIMVVGIAVLVALLMYVLTSPDYRVRW